MPLPRLHLLLLALRHVALNIAIDSPSGLVDRALRARVDEQIVQQTSEECAAEGRHHGHPEVVIARAPDVRAVADGVGHESGAEVTGEVDGVACFIS